jgi:methionyl-tRNA formyltransferase
VKRNNILFLGNTESKTTLIPFLISMGHNVEVQTKPVSSIEDFDLVISYNYKNILSIETLESAKYKPINLHISLLPFNRGQHPNFWAHFDGTPSGISIHHIDGGIDTGDIIFQKQIDFSQSEKTFKDTWVRLNIEIENLFICNFEKILKHDYKAIPQKLNGTFHLGSDLPSDFLGWDSEIEVEIARLRALRNK